MTSEDTEAVIGESMLANSSSSNTKYRVQAPDQTSVQPLAVSDWSWCGARVPKNQVTYMTQVVLVYCIIAVSLTQLVRQSADSELWLVLLSTSVGYILPSPRLKFLKPKISVTPTATTNSLTSSLSFPPVNVADTRDVIAGDTDTEAGKACHN